jgi:BirA family transcriptional regulator, biotin operon repressor / biotin---[acetyl-CoA-carboxylase] ligase
VSDEGPAAGRPARALGRPRVHFRCTDSTNDRARTLALAGAPHGTLVTAAEQTTGRGRQGRSWVAPAGSALLCSLILRDPPPLLSLLAGVAVCDVAGERARLKWPNDIVVEVPPSPPVRTRGAYPAQHPTTTGSGPAQAPPQEGSLAKLAGILVEGRPQEGWAVVGIGLNVAVPLDRLPADVRAGAASLELPPSAIEPLLKNLLESLQSRLSEPPESVLGVWRSRDALLGRTISWGTPPPAKGPPASSAPDSGDEQGRAMGIDDQGRLIVGLSDGSTAKLDAGEIHLGPSH